MDTGKPKTQLKKEDEFSGKGRTYVGHEDPYLESLAVGRYKFALNYIHEGSVCLDAASGSGYGTEMISQKAGKVIGLEYDLESIKFAKQHHNNSNIEYRQADLTCKLDLSNSYFDVIISIETIEHITEHNMMMSEFRRVLKPGGLLIASTVEHEIYSEKGGIKNPHHVGELTKKQLLDLISLYFKPEEVYGQIKYLPLTWRQKLAKTAWIPFLTIVGKLDFLNLRYRIADLLHLHRLVVAVNNSYSSMADTSMEKTDFSDKNNYYQLMVIARKTSG